MQYHPTHDGSWWIRLHHRGITVLSCPGKLFARIVLSSVKNLVLTKRQNKNSGRTPGRQNLHVKNAAANQRRLQPFSWIAHVDPEAAFGSIDRDTFSCVSVDGQPSDWFAVNSSVRQGCTITPDLWLNLFSLLWTSCNKRLDHSA